MRWKGLLWYEDLSQEVMFWNLGPRVPQLNVANKVDLLLNLMASTIRTPVTSMEHFSHMSYPITLSDSSHISPVSSFLKATNVFGGGWVLIPLLHLCMLLGSSRVHRDMFTGRKRYHDDGKARFVGKILPFDRIPLSKTPTPLLFHLAVKSRKVIRCAVAWRSSKNPWLLLGK